MNQTKSDLLADALLECIYGEWLAAKSSDSTYSWDRAISYIHGVIGATYVFGWPSEQLKEDVMFLWNIAQERYRLAMQESYGAGTITIATRWP